MFGYRPPAHSELLIKEVIDTLIEYFYKLESGLDKSMIADPIYKYKHYKIVDIDTMRSKLQKMDQYLNEKGQRNWARGHYGIKFKRGPDLNRLSDNAVICLFQELDSIYCKGK